MNLSCFGCWRRMNRSKQHSRLRNKKNNVIVVKGTAILFIVSQFNVRVHIPIRPCGYVKPLAQHAQVKRIVHTLNIVQDFPIFIHYIMFVVLEIHKTCTNRKDFLWLLIIRFRCSFALPGKRHRRVWFPPNDNIIV